MSLKNRAKAAARKLEGKIQETVGDLTGNPEAQAEGEEKQDEADVLQTTEDVKDEVKATAKDVEGKIQETVGDLTGNPEAQAEGEEKQDEADVLQTTEDEDEVKQKVD